MPGWDLEQTWALWHRSPWMFGAPIHQPAPGGTQVGGRVVNSCTWEAQGWPGAEQVSPK